MKILSICSHKGGVGKTTLALNLGLSFARADYRTLIVDVDPQGAIGLSLARERQHLAGVAELLAHRCSVDEAIMKTRLSTLSLLPIGRLRMRQAAVFDRHLEDGKRLSEFLGACADRFDLVVIDTPAGFGGATIGALRASTHFLSPLSADPLTMRGAPEVLELALWLREEYGGPEFLGFVMTMVDYLEPESVAVLHEARQRFGSRWLFETTIRRDPLFLEASAAGSPISLLGRTPPRIATVFDQLVLEIESLLAPNAEGEDHDPIPLID